jgi:hypothetical protein
VSDLARDDLAQVLAAVRAETAALSDVRIAIAELNGTVSTLATEVRLQVAALTEAQKASEVRDTAIEKRVTSLEQWQWRVAGAIGLLGILAGGVGSVLASSIV